MPEARPHPVQGTTTLPVFNSAERGSMETTFIEILDQWGTGALMICASMWFVKYMFDKFMVMLDEEKDEHKQEMLSQVEAVNNNTIVMKQILEVIRGCKNNESND